MVESLLICLKSSSQLNFKHAFTGGTRERESLSHWLVKMSNCAVTVEMKWLALRNWKKEVPFNLAVWLSVIYPKTCTTTPQKYPSRHVYCCTILNGQETEPTWCPAKAGYFKKIWYINTTKIYADVKKSKIIYICQENGWNWKSC